jgi:hypothetical protein
MKMGTPVSHDGRTRSEHRRGLELGGLEEILVGLA